MADVRESTGVFLPADPPRAGHLALWPPPPNVPGATATIEVASATKTSVRRAQVDALLIPMVDAIGWLADPPPDTSPSVRAWAVAAQLGLELIARGRLLPAASPSGWDAWRVGPLDPRDVRRLAELTKAFPPEAHAMPIPGTRPLRIRSAESLIRDLWDAMADALARSPAAAMATENPAFAARAPTDVNDLAEWLATADRALDSGTRPGLRLELPDGPDGDVRAVVQLASRADPSLVIDAADLWDVSRTG